MLEKLSQIEAEMDDCLSTCDGNGMEEIGGKTHTLPQNDQTKFRLDSEGGVSVSTPSTSSSSSDKQGEELVPLTSTCAIIDIPPVKISAPSGTNSDSSLAGSSSSNSAGLVTINLKPNCCYLYKVEYTREGSVLSCTRSAQSLSAVDNKLGTYSPLSRAQSCRSTLHISRLV